jgi:uncharacterized protein (DUF488 family)
MSVPPLFTIGYEHQTQAAVIDKLKAAGVDLVLDLRAIAASRRAGFSKTILSASLNAEHIGYLHLRDLGTPKAGRDAAHHGRIAEMRAIYEAHLQEPAAIVALERAIDETRTHKAALLCYEADAAGCHRRIVAERIHAHTGAKVIDL